MELDDTKPEYYEGWRKAGMDSLVPKSFNIVDLPRNRWPDFSRWAWTVFMGQIWDFNGDYPDYRVGDLRRLFTLGERRLWLWDHNGAGDFVRISSQDNNDRLIVVFNHEDGERSPWANEPGEYKYAPGLDFLQPIDLDEIYRSDTLPFSDKLASMTEAYRYRISFSSQLLTNMDGEMSDELRAYYEERLEKDPDRIITSPEVLTLGNGFSDEGEFGPVNESELKWLEPEVVERRPRFVKLYEDLLAGNLPTLTELHDLLKHDLVTATAFDAMHRIADQWIPDPEDRHRRSMENNNA